MRTAGIAGGMKYKMKSILISTHPEWCEKICHVIGKEEAGKPIYEKRIEVRKSAPKEVPFKAYIYCTSSNVHDCILIDKSGLVLTYATNHKTAIVDSGYCGNGKVIGEFICDKVYLIKNQRNRFVVANEEQGVTNEIARQSCLDYDDMVNYLGDKDGYGWHISDLKIYNKPKELSEFCIPCKGSCENCKNPLYFECRCEEKGKKIVTRPPQSWQYVEELGNE